MIPFDMHAVFVSLVIALMRTLVPIGEHNYYEKPEQTWARYVEVAEVIVTVAFDPSEEPVEGTDRLHTAYLMASVAARESYFRRDIVDCSNYGLGHAWSAWQIQRPHREVCLSLEQGARRALHMIQESFQVCSNYPLPDKLAFYTDGKCVRNWLRSSYRVLPAFD